MLILLAAGGTGGHLFPAEAVASTLLQQGQQPVLLTDHRGAAFLPESPPFAVEILYTPPPHRMRGIYKLALPFAWIRSVLQAVRLLRRLQPAVVAGFGGYPSVPALLAARLLHIPSVIHEQNAIMGRSNRKLARFARHIALTCDPTGAIPAKTRAHCSIIGNPVRAGFTAFTPRQYIAPQPDQPVALLITGGSQGASIFASVIPDAIALLPESLQKRLHITQQARADQVKDLQARYKTMGVLADVASFYNDMPARLATSHLMIGRSGASTLAELQVYGKPSILIPYVHAMDDHQTANARILADAGAAMLLPQPSLTAKQLADTLQSLLEDTDKLTALADASRKLARPEAAQALAQLILHT